MTYSIVARCPLTGRLGVGTATYSIACGRRNESVRPGAGICKSQAFYLRSADPRGLDLLAAGHTPDQVLGELRAGDPDFDYRQIGIIDRAGNAIAHTGARVGQWAGHETGDGFAAFGNVLAGPQVVAGIARGFQAAAGAPLEWRLLAAIEGGRDAGGQAFDGAPRPERSAWIRVIGALDHPEIDVRVDLHPSAVAELRRVLETIAAAA